MILMENEQPYRERYAKKNNKKNTSLYELRLKFGPLKCLHHLFYPNRAGFFSTRTIFTRARTKVKWSEVMLLVSPLGAFQD